MPVNKLLELQSLDLKIERCRGQETEIPKQKCKFDVQRKRLDAELRGSEQLVKNMQIEQRECEGEIAQKEAQIKKYEGQLATVKKNDEYQMLLHEIDIQRKQIGVKEERILMIMEEMEGAKSKFAEDKKRIDAERAKIDAQCAEIDAELKEAVAQREVYEAKRGTIASQVDAAMLRRYDRIRAAKKGGRVVVPLEGESCGGCHMAVRAQIVNEILAGEPHSCGQCGRILFDPEIIAGIVETAPAE
jgi:predicted  nucleic acid-binding Zn-ribbon protein